MATIPNQTPEQQQAVAAFQAKYPHIPPGGRLLQAWLGSHPEAYPDIKALSEILGIPEGRQLNPGTMSSERVASKIETILTAAAIVGGGYIAGTALAGAAGAGAGAGGGAAAGTGAGAAGAGTAGALEGGGTLAANLGGAGALGAGGAAGTGAAAAGTAGALASTPMATSYVAPVAGSAGISSAAEGITAAGATPSIWDKIFGKSTADKVMTGLGMAGGLAGSLIQSNQADKATKAQQEAAAKALELQSNIYQQQRADLAPYRQAGASSLSALTYGLGLDPSKSADTTTPYFNQQAQAQNNAVSQNAQRNPNSPTTQPIPAGNYTGGQAVPRVSSLAPTAGDGTVSMMSPDGRQARVPQNQVQAALAAGGRLA